ncbi:MAG: Gfo/Idh/MocA family oxidoreductase [Planctomycetaceae bacterium]
MLNRREFIQTSAAAVSSFAVPAIVSGRNLNSKLQLAAIGCDGKGWSDTHEMSSHPKVQHVAFCDIDTNRMQKALKLRPKTPTFQDYRQMLADMGDSIDAVTVSTPDHMHAKPTLDAMRLGKHVFCQKPLTHTVWEARQVQLQAAKSGVITRMGNQIHSHSHYRTAVQLIQDGRIGRVKEVRSWCAATGHGKSFHISRPKMPPAVPQHVDWELWIGVAPLRPYGGDRVYHPWGWRDWQDFGNGALGDFGCHILDPVFTALQITQPPQQLRTDHSGMNDEVWPAQTSVKYTFPGTPYTVPDKPLSVSWDDGGRLPSVTGSHVPSTTALPRSGSLLIGEQGSLVLPHVAAPRLYPENQFAGTKIHAAEDLNHYHGWIDGCLSGHQPSDGFAYAGPLTEAVLLGNIAARFRGQTLQWDAKAMRITNLPEANSWLTRGYRQGWNISSTT